VRALRVVLMALLLGMLAVVPVALAQGESPAHQHEHGSEVDETGQHEHGSEVDEAGQHEHGSEVREAGQHEHEHGEGEADDDHAHLPIQMYAIKAYFEAPWGDPTQPGRIAWQAGLLALVDAALLAWLWRRWWR